MKGAHVHVVGVAGVGMSALAQALVGRGCKVTGSDRFHDTGDSLEVLRQLERAGIAVVPQDGSGITAETAYVAISTAIEDDNLDIQTAHRLGIPVIHRAAMLAKLTEGRRCIAITGTCGKSTVTGMAGWILEHAGWDPTVVNGAPLLDWRSPERVGNVRCGASDWWIIEADESDRSLLQFEPEFALITNMSKDHFELDETRLLFDRFAARVKVRLINASDPGGLLSSFTPDVYADRSIFRHEGHTYEILLPGRHNAENALCAVALCLAIGCPPAAIASGLRTFRGIHRRLERVGAARNITVMDDYAHNPAKIEAALKTLQPFYKRIVIVWRPHGYKPLITMLPDLHAMFEANLRAKDRLLLLPVFDAGGTANRTIRSELLAEPLAAQGLQVSVAPDYESVLCQIRTLVEPGDAVITMGARDPHLPALACRILQKLA